MHKTIQFTCSHSKDTVEFLDTRVLFDPETNELYTTVYTKPTDTRDYLLITSAHPLSTNIGGANGQFLRLRFICTKDYDFDVESRALFLAYIKRGYPKHVLEEHFHRASLFGLCSTNDLDTKIKEKTDKQVFVTIYNLANSNLMGIIRNYWPIIQTSKALGRLFSEFPMCAFRRQKKM